MIIIIKKKLLLLTKYIKKFKLINKINNNASKKEKGIKLLNRCGTLHSYLFHIPPIIFK